MVWPRGLLAPASGQRITTARLEAGRSSGPRANGPILSCVPQKTAHPPVLPRRVCMGSDSGRSYPPGVGLKNRKRRSPGDRTTGATAAHCSSHGSHARTEAPHKATGCSLSLQHPMPAGPATIRKGSAPNRGGQRGPSGLEIRYARRFPPVPFHCGTGATLYKTPVEGGAEMGGGGRRSVRWNSGGKGGGERGDRTSRAAPARPVGGGNRLGAPPGGSLSQRPGPRRPSAPAPPHRQRTGPRAPTPRADREVLPTRRQGVILQSTGHQGMNARRTRPAVGSPRGSHARAATAAVISDSRSSTHTD